MTLIERNRIEAEFYFLKIILKFYLKCSDNKNNINRTYLITFIQRQTLHDCVMYLGKIIAYEFIYV